MCTLGGYIYSGLNMSETSIRIRVPTELHEQFNTTCKANDLTASQVLRAAMREYINRNKSHSSVNIDKQEKANGE